MNMIDSIQDISKTYHRQAQLFKVLMHPVRLAILDILRDGEQCVCHMEAYLGYPQAYLSQQLGVLRRAGLIQDRKDGWNVFYHVTESQIYEILDMARGITQIEEHVIPSQTACPCPKCNP
jgi:ArsR family transcriptional regulator